MKRLLLVLVLLGGVCHSRAQIDSGAFSNPQSVIDTLASADEEPEEFDGLSIEQADSIALLWGKKRGIFDRVFGDWKRHTYYIDADSPNFSVGLTDSTGERTAGRIGVFAWGEERPVDTITGTLEIIGLEVKGIVDAGNFCVSKGMSILLSSMQGIDFIRCSTPSLDISNTDIKGLTFRKVAIAELTLDKFLTDFFKDDVSEYAKSLGAINSVSIQESRISKIIIEGYRIHELLIGSNIDRDSNVLQDIDTLMSKDATYDSVICYHSGSVKRIAFTDDKIATIIHIAVNRLSELVLTNCDVGELNIAQSTLVDSLVIRNTHFSKTARISCLIKGVVQLQNITFDNGAELNIYGLYDTLPSGKRRRIPINLFDVDIAKVHLDWRSFALQYTPNDDKEAIYGIYQDLFENFKRRGQTASLALLDKEFQSFRNRNIPIIGLVWDKTEMLWWNYGYGGWQVIIWTLLLPFIWAFIIPYRKILHMHSQVYAVDNFEPIVSLPNKNQWWKKYTRKLTYVAVIFYALSIKFDKLHYKHGGLIALFVAIYLNGIFCLFFIANFLLKA